MKTILSLLIIATVMFSCKNEAKPEIKTVEVETKSKKALDPNATYAKAEFTIEGMSCAVGCAATIQKQIGKMDGVKSAVVDFDKKLAMVEYNEATVTPASIESTVVNVAKDLYEVRDMKTVDAFSIGKACAAGCTKSCCANKDKKTCEAGCKKACCTGKHTDKKACAADCTKACCSEKKEA